MKVNQIHELGKLKIGKWIFLVSVFFFALLHMSSVGAVDIAACTNLSDEKTTYVLTANIVNSNKKICINITEGNITLNCGGYRIDGVDTDGTYGISSNSSNTTILNCFVNDWDYGIYYNNSDGSKTINVTANSSYHGIYLDPYSSKNILDNITANNNSYGIYLDSSSSSKNILTNIIANSNEEAGIYLSSSNFTTLSNITANSNNIGIYLDSSSSKSNLIDITANSNNYGIYLDYSSNINLTDITANSNDEGIYLYHSYPRNRLIDITANSNNGDGIELYYSSNNLLTNITANSNGYGIYLRSSSNINLTNIIANSNNHYGIDLYESSNNSLTNITVNSNNQSGIYLRTSSNNNTIQNSRIENSSGNYAGIYLYSSASNTIYNNFFNNTVNYNLSGTIYPNDWNTTQQTGTRIISPSYFSEIAGNFWTSPDGKGFSDNCTDINYDGFCDSPYYLNQTEDTRNVDWMPLSNNIKPTLINASADKTKLNVSDNITFTVWWNDTEDTAKILIDNDSSFTDCNFTVTTGCLCNDTGKVGGSSGNFSTCFYTAQDSDPRNITWFAQVCDDGGLCNATNISGDSVNGTFQINHYIRLKDLKIYNNSLFEKSIFNSGEKIRIRVNATDYYGAGDLDKVLISILDPAARIVVMNESMSNITQITNGFVYEYNFTTQNVNGTWQVTIFANGSEGLANYTSGNFYVTSEFGMTLDIIWDKKQYVKRDTASIIVRVRKSSNLHGLSGVTVRGNMTEPSGAITQLSFTEDGNGNYSTSYQFLRTGVYFMNVTANKTNYATNYVNEYINIPLLPVYLQIVGGTEYQQGEIIKITAFLTDSEGDPVTNAVCNVTIFYPNSTLWINKSGMQEINQVELSGVYVWNETAPNVEGVYSSWVNCTYSGNSSYASHTFHVAHWATQIAEINVTSKEINETVHYIWERFERVNTSVIHNETVHSAILNKTSRIIIEYNITIPLKQGYSSEDYMPIRWKYWFLNSTGNCVDQASETYNVESPYCNPLIAQWVGLGNGTYVLNITLTPSLASGNYTLVRELEVDPQQVWVSYGIGPIARITVLDNSEEAPYAIVNPSSDSRVTPSLSIVKDKTEKKKPKTINLVGMASKKKIPLEQYYPIIAILIAIAFVFTYLKTKNSTSGKEKKRKWYEKV